MEGVLKSVVQGGNLNQWEMVGWPIHITFSHIFRLD
jgi:hypothetical protein